MADFSACWKHYNPVRVISGPGALRSVAELLPSRGDILLVTTAGWTGRGGTERLLDLTGRERTLVCDEITPNPDLDMLDDMTRRYKGNGFAAILAFGGGSVIDVGKSLGAILACGEDAPLDKILRHGRDLSRTSPVPVVAAPTTAGTGAEVTPFATVWDGKFRRKHSLAGDHVYASAAVLDPELTLTMPFRETLYTGLDAVSHALESLWNKNRSPVSEAHAFRALALATESLPAVLKEPENIGYRAGMQTAAMLAGLAISGTRTAIAHGLSYPFTIHYGIPHGLACGFTLPGLLDRYMSSLGDGYERRLLKSVFDMLGRFRLKKEMAAYLKDKNWRGMPDDVFQSDRAGNYVMPMRDEDIRALLDGSIGDIPESEG